MRLGPQFRRAFFERPCLEVAPELLGSTLVHRLPDGSRLAGRVVEVEAYLGDGSDPGSHTHRGPPPRNRAMFGPAGRLYVYRSYGIHLCANVVCERAGTGAAVLFRALEPVLSADRMRRLRGLAADAPDRDIASGPGKLTQALGIEIDDYGTNLLRGRLMLRQAAPGDGSIEVARSRRIGLSQGADLPFRFYVPGHPCVSRTRRGAPGRV